MVVLMGAIMDDWFAMRKLQEEFEDTKGPIIIRKSKDRQHNGQKKKDTQ
jgi:hypothetical protein